MPDLQFLLVGDVQRTEFREAASCLERMAAVEQARDVEAAQAVLDREYAPDAIVVAQSYPGEFSHEAVDRLRRAAPLARIIGLMGTWCEGDLRSGRPWPATARLYWHQWPARCRRQLRALAGGERCSFSLPSTATEEERLLADAASPRPLGEGQKTVSPLPLGEGPGVRAGESAEYRVQGSGVSEQEASDRPADAERPGSVFPRGAWEQDERCIGLAVIRCRSFETWDWLSAACRRRGLASVWQRDGVAGRIEGATAAVFDCDDLDDAEFAELRRLAAALRPAPVLALMSFPRIEDQCRAVAAGAAAVLSKPLVLEDLFGELDRPAG